MNEDELKEIERRAAVGGPQIPRLWGGERNPVFDSIRTDIPRLCQELRRAWSRIEAAQNVIKRAKFVDDYSDSIRLGFTPGESDTDDCCDLSLTWLHEALVAYEQTQPKEGGGQDE